MNPLCPEHGFEMRYELGPNWWRGKCGCQIRVFEEDRRAYVPATHLGQRVRGFNGELLGFLRACASTIWYPLCKEAASVPPPPPAPEEIGHRERRVKS